MIALPASASNDSSSKPAARKSVVVLAALLLGILSGCEARRADKELQRALDLAAAGKPAEALEIVRRIEADHPDTPAAARAARLRPLYEGLVSARTRYPTRLAVDSLRRLARAVEEHRIRTGALPTELEDLEGDPDLPLLDPWGNEFVYRRRGGERYSLVCLGADGQAGGSGPDEDIRIDDGVLTKAPAWGER